MSQDAEEYPDETEKPDSDLNESKRSLEARVRSIPRRIWQFAAYLVTAIAIVVAALIPPLQDDNVPEKIEVERLQEVEEDCYLRPEAGAPRLSSFKEYFGEDNRGIYEHFSKLAVHLREGSAPISRATYVSGPAGSGKSSVVKPILIAQFPGFCEIDLKEVLERPPRQSDLLRNDPQEDLASDQLSLVFNSLPSVRRPIPETLTSLEEYLPELQSLAGCETMDADVIVLDGLDEIHPDMALELLRDIEQHLSSKPDPGEFLHFVVLGRPEAFTEHLNDDSTGESSGFVKTFEVATIKLVTVGDLQMRAHDYWMHRKLGEEAPNRVVSEFVDLVRSNPALGCGIGSLYVSGRVLSGIQSEADFSSEEKLFASIHSELLSRADDKHGRPSANRGYYFNLLQEVASQYVSEVDDNGFFQVHVHDLVLVRDDSFTVKDRVRAKDVLDRSGLITVQPIDHSVSRYRFEPVFVHRYLVERRNQRIDSAK